jgi:transcriptional regulator with XRE-family HTH domain
MQKKEINIEVGHRIQMVREKCGYTQEQFAEMLDVGVQHISNIERGVVGISLTALRNACQVLDISADYLLMGKNSSGTTNLLVQQINQLPVDQMVQVEKGFSQILEALNLANQQKTIPSENSSKQQ